MTLETTTSRARYDGTGTTGPFPFPFRILAAADLLVTKLSAALSETVLVLGADYTVAGTGDASGSVTTIAAVAVGEQIVIRRKPALKQPVSVRNQGAFLASSHEDEFDRLVMQLQSLQDSVDRSVKLRETIAGAGGLVELLPEAGKAVVGTGTGFTMATLDSSAVALPGSARTVLTLSAYLLNNAVYNIKDYGASPAGGAVANAAGIQACINAAPAGSLVYTPGGQGDYLITGAAAQILLCAKALRFVGDSFSGSRWAVAYDVAATVDALRVQGANFDSWRMEMMSIVPQAAPAVAGVGTVSCAAGVATFSNSQAGVLTVGGKVTVAGTPYTVLSFNGTLSARLSSAPTFGASAFTTSRVPGRFGVNFDVQAGYIANVVMEHIAVGPFGDDALRCTNPVPAIDGLFLVSIDDSVISGGCGLLKAGDNVSIKRTNIVGVRGLVVDLVPGTDGGAHGFELIGGNVTCASGIQILNASACYINVNMEAPEKSTSPNGAMIDLVGSAGSPLANVVIDGGFLGGTTGNCDCVIRSDWVVKPLFRDNYIVPPGLLTDPTPRCAWRVTANAIAVVIRNPHVSPFGVLLDTILDDLGIGTDIQQWRSPTGSYPVYDGHKAQKQTERVIQAGKAQTAGSVILAIIAAATTAVNRAIQGYLRVMGNGNVIVGDGADTGFPLQVNGGSQFNGQITQNGNFKLNTLGNGFYIKEGADATMGTAVLVAGTKVVNTVKVTANSRIFLTTNVPGGAPGWLQVSARTVGVGFTILSSNAGDTSTVGWMIVEPA